MDSEQSPAVALLCPGPSLLRVWKDAFFAEYQVVIAINSAGHKFRNHWTAAVDRHIIAPFLDEKVPLPKIGFLTNNAWGKKLKDKFGVRYINPGPYSGEDIDLRNRHITGSDRCGYTMPNALWFANLTGLEIHVYGFDCAVGKECIGGFHGDRKPHRWLKELVWLKGYWHQGIIVNSDIRNEVLNWLNDGNRDITNPPE